MPDENGNPIEGEEGYVPPDTTGDTTGDNGVGDGSADSGSENTTPSVDDTDGITKPYDDIATSALAGAPKSSDYADYDAASAGSAVDTNTSINEGGDYITDKSTVSGQLKSLLDQDSPYIEQAKLGAAEQAAGRGMLNSSMAAGAGQRAAIKAALPIAQQDAQTAAQFQSNQQQAENQLETMQAEAIVSGEIVKQQAAVNQKNQNINNSFQAQIAGADAGTKEFLADLQNQYNVSMQELTHVQNVALQNAEITANRAAQVRESSASIMQNYQISVENMMTDPDFLSMGTTAVNNAIKEMKELATNSIAFIGASAGVSMDSYIEQYLTNVGSDLDMSTGDFERG